MEHRARISIFGGRKISKENYHKAYSLGKFLNKNEYLIYCGVGEGVMEAVAKGVNEVGGNVSEY